MNNHYHLLLETTKENISDALRHLNSNYAAYFNKKHKRYGALWQSRFYSSLLFDDEHFWIVAKYIERNPIKANVVKQLEHYKYQSLFQYMYNHKHSLLIQHSKILSMTREEYHTFLNTEMDDTVLQKVYTTPVVTQNQEGERVVLYKRIEEFFEHDKDIYRTQGIISAHQYGYSKAQIADFLGISDTAVSKYVKNYAL